MELIDIGHIRLQTGLENRPVCRKIRSQAISCPLRSPDSEIRSWVEDREEGNRTERHWEARSQAGSGAHICTAGDYGSEAGGF